MVKVFSSDEYAEYPENLIIEDSDVTGNGTGDSVGVMIKPTSMPSDVTCFFVCFVFCSP